jgi:hypothetical protein
MRAESIGDTEQWGMANLNFFGGFVQIETRGILF